MGDKYLQLQSKATLSSISSGNLLREYLRYTLHVLDTFYEMAEAEVLAERAPIGAMVGVINKSLTDRI